MRIKKKLKKGGYMDWSIFWTAFGAIGTTVGSLITAIAVLVAVIQYKQPLKKRIKITVSTSFPVFDYGLGESYLCISLANTGVRTVIITNIYLNAGRKNYVINNLMVDLQNDDTRVKFPKELLPENVIEVHIPYVKLSESFTDLIYRSDIYPNKRIKVLATDTSSGKYYCKTKLKAKHIAKLK